MQMDNITFLSRQRCPSPAQTKLKNEAVLIKYDLLLHYLKHILVHRLALIREVCEQEAAAILLPVM